MANKYSLDNSPYLYNVFRNGNVWIKGFDCLSAALRYCERYSKRSYTLIELYSSVSGVNRLVKSWN